MSVSMVIPQQNACAQNGEHTNTYLLADRVRSGRVLGYDLPLEISRTLDRCRKQHPEQRAQTNVWATKKQQRSEILEKKSLKKQNKKARRIKTPNNTNTTQKQTTNHTTPHHPTPNETERTHKRTKTNQNNKKKRTNNTKIRGMVKGLLYRVAMLLLPSSTVLSTLSGDVSARKSYTFVRPVPLATRSTETRVMFRVRFMYCKKRGGDGEKRFGEKGLMYQC